MRRPFVVVGLVVFALLLFASISATMAAPRNAPLLQSTVESEPNNSFEEADPVSLPGYVTGVVSNTDTMDYFEMDTVKERQYQASLNVLSNMGELTLMMHLYNGNRNLVKTSSSSSSYTSMSWTAYEDSHYVRVEAIVVTTATVQRGEYRLDLDELAATPTATNTPSPDPWDEYEPNDSLDEAHTLPVKQSVKLEDLNFHPYSDREGPDEDWFALYVRDGRRYEATTGELDNVDTYMEIRDQEYSVVESSEDDGGGFASQAKWKASYDGYYYIRIINRIGTSDRDSTYALTVEESSSTATPAPTPGPGPTQISGLDQFEPNYDFDHAAAIGSDVTYQANFIPWAGYSEDNDFYKIWIKPGLHFTCETLDLAPGVDTNMIVFTGPSWDNAIGGSDDIELGEYRSRFSYLSTYEGWLYILIGHGGRLSVTDVKDSDYSLRCEKLVPGQPTAARTPGPTATPASRDGTPTAPGSPVATPTSPEGLTVRTLTTPTPVPATTPAPRFIPITLLAYYDDNDDGQPGAGEGVAGLSVQAYEAATNQLLAQGFTDEQGSLEFTVAAQGPVHVSVPFFGFSQLVGGEGVNIYLRVPGQSLLGGRP